MGKGSAPQAPDPYAAAGAQYQYGTQAAAYNAALNRVNQTSPTGSTSYNITGTSPTGAPTYQQTTSLSPALQGIYDPAANQARAGIQNNPLPDTGGLQNFGQEAMQRAYKLNTATMDPYWTQSEASLDSQLRNSGAHPGDPAYDHAMTQFRAQRTGAYGQAENAAFGQGLGAQGEMISQIGQERGIPLNEMQAITGGQQVSPAAQSTAGTPDIMQAFQNQYQGQLSNYNANVASTNADVGAAASIIAALVMHSDKRSKKDIERTGEKTPAGIELVKYRYNFEPKGAPKRKGVIAQEVEKKAPEAVLKDAKGMRYVDYSKVP